MTVPGAPDPARPLVAYAEAMRRLAHRLVYDEDLADDVAQDAAALALRRPAPPPWAPWAWLSGIVKNTARNTLRGERRRRAREEQAAGGAGGPRLRPGDAAERVEQQRRVLDAVLRLEEPYRSHVVWRYLDGASVDEIAERVSVPRETVRTRLRRALDRLRADLDARAEGRRHWSLALLPLAAPAPMPAPVVSVAGGIVVKKAVIWVGALVLLAGAIGAAWMFLPDRGRDAASLGVESGDLGKGESPGGLAARAPRVAESDPPVDLSKADLDLDLHGVVVRRDGRPVAGADLRVVTYPWRRTTVLSSEDYDTVVEGPSARTASDGSFSIRLSRGERVSLRVTAAGLATVERRGCTAGERLRVVLPRGTTCIVRVRDESGGGVSEAFVRLFSSAEEEFVFDRRGVTADDGTVRFDGLPGATVARVEVNPRAHAGTGWSRVNLPIESEATIDVVVRPGRRVTGRVTDGATSKPISGARVGLGWVQRMPVRTDDEGRFALLWDAQQGHEEIYVSADGFGIEGRPVGDASTLDVVLAPGDSVAGRVVDSRGAPVGEVLVATVPIGPRAGSIESDTSRTATTGPDGRFLVAGIRRTLEHGVVFLCPGKGRHVVDVAPRAEGPGTVDLGDVVLADPRRIEGRVLDTEGTPASRAVVSLKGANADRRRRIGTEETGRSFYGQTEEAHTDHLGRFRFADLSPGTYALSLRTPGRASANREVVLGDSDVLDADLAMAPAREVVIRVRDAGEAPLVGAYVTLRNPRSERISGQTDADGNLRAFLPTGRWTLSISPLEDETWGGSRRFLPVSNREIEPDEAEVVVVFEEAQTVEGVVRKETGEPVESARVTTSEATRALGTVVTDARGRFTARVPKDAVVDVHAVWSEKAQRAPDGSASAALWRAQRSRVRAGTAGLVLALSRVAQDRVLTFRVTSPEGTPHAGARVSLHAASGSSWQTASSDAEGRASFTGLTDEPWSGIAFPGRPHAADWVPVRVGPLDPQPGGHDSVHALAFAVGVKVEGRVLDGDGNAVDGAAVEVVADDSAHASSTTTSSGGGRFRLLLDPALRMPVTLRAAGPPGESLMRLDAFPRDPVVLRMPKVPARR